MASIGSSIGSSGVRVRYAPSPTGLQHIGGVRTALFNYLFARSQRGSFVLRLEDTDRTRFDERYVANLYDTLSWLGIDWDEGGDKGGPYAPYVQSERFQLYRKYAHELVDKGEAYWCFCDAERLERIRKIQTENKMPPGYDRNCRHLTADEVKASLASGKKGVIRLKVPLEGETRFTDALLGEIIWKNEDISPDPILLKSDGFPTYHLANVVDDHLMGITHVMRAQEWIPSTPLHVQIYRAFGWTPPQFCHLPMVNGSDGKKLSKRHGSTSIDEFRAKGYLPESLVNYVALLGCSYEEGRDFYTLDELAAGFDVSHLNKAPAVFDYKKLEFFNGSYIRQLTDEELYQRTLPFITGTGDGALKTAQELAVGPAVSGVALGEGGKPYCVDASLGLTSDQVESRLLGLMPLIKERLRYLSDAAAMAGFLFKRIDAPAKADLIPKKLDEAKTRTVLERARGFIDVVFSSSHEIAEEAAKAIAGELGVKLGDFMMPVRVAVTGSRVSPPLIGSIRLLGREEAVRRVEAAGAAVLGGKGGGGS